ncbi:MAG: hypothetical protein Q8N56_04405 [bacterium]|nr:hypothetical protein [bacterium]
MKGYACDCACYTCKNGTFEQHCSHCRKNHSIDLEFTTEHKPMAIIIGKTAVTPNKPVELIGTYHQESLFPSQPKAGGR